MAERLGEAVLVLRTDDSRYSSAVARAEVGARKLDRRLSKTGGSARTLGARLTALGGRVRSLGRSFFNLRNAAILAAGVTGLAFMVKKAIDTADEISKMSAIIGISTDAFQRYRFAAGQAGVSSEKFTVGLQAFGKRLGEARAGTGSMVTILRKMNPELLNTLLRTNSVEEAFRIMIQALSDTVSQTDKMALSAAAFSRGAGLAFVNIANDGLEVFDEWGDRLKRLGGILSKELIDGAVMAKDELSLVTTAIGIQFTAALLEATPLISEMATEFAEAIPSIVEFVKQTVHFIRDDLAPVIRTMADFFAAFFDALVKGILTFRLAFRINIAGVTLIIDTFIDLVQGFIEIVKIALRSASEFFGISAPADGTFQRQRGLRKFQSGGSFIVPGSGGIDSQFVPIMATPGEQITVTPEGGMQGGTRFNIDARGADLGIERRIERAMHRAVRLGSLQAGGQFAAALRASGA